MTSQHELRVRLAKRQAPLDLVIGSDGDIVAKDFSFGKAFDYSVVFHHSEGEIEVGEDVPTRREWFVFGEDFDTLPQAERRLRALEVAEDLGEPPCPQDGDLDEWLDQKVESDCFEPSCGLSEHLPGLDIVEGLLPIVCLQLGLKKVDIGGPASVVEAAVLCRDVEALDMAIREAELPYRVVAADRAEG